MFFPAGEPQTVQVGVKPNNNYPLDIYYLMDLSYSMNDDLQSLQTLASQLGVLKFLILKY